jgi:DNA-binding GntR family transcriptional regulator
MSQSAPTSRSVLSSQVKDRLLHAIITGRYKPGDRIVETRVAHELGTSQAPVREALRDLGALGVVEISAFRGAQVRRPATDELMEAFVIRAGLESLGMRLAVPRLTDADLDELRKAVEDMDRAAEAGDPYAEATADAGFHGRIIEIAGNSILERVWGSLEPFSRTYITLAVASAYGRQMADLHRPVLEALEGRDAERAVEAIRRHFNVAADMFGRVWAERSPWIAEPANPELPPGAGPGDPGRPGPQQDTTDGRPSRRGRRT